MNPDFDFRSLKGHSAALGELTKAGRLEPFPSLVFGGPPNVGKRLAAIWFAAFLNCHQSESSAPCGQCSSCKKFASGGHPDLLVTATPEKKTVIGVSEVREGVHEISHSPFEANFRVWILENGERLTDEAQNALLKTLEEPPAQAVIVLVTSLESTLLPTVTSRCRLVRFQALDPQAVEEALITLGTETALAHRLSSVCGGGLGAALGLARQPKVLEEQESVIDLFCGLPGKNLWGVVEAAQTLEKAKFASLSFLLGLGMSVYRDLLMLAAGAPDLVVHKQRLPQLQELAQGLSLKQIRSALRSFQEADSYLQRNVSPRLLLQRLCLDLGECVGAGQKGS